MIWKPLNSIHMKGADLLHSLVSSSLLKVKPVNVKNRKETGPIIRFFHFQEINSNYTL